MSRPIQIRMGGYGPATTGFSKSLKFIGERLEKQFGDRVDVKYVWNIMDFGYRAEDILWLVESGVLTLGYQSSSYLTDRVPELGFVDLPFLFSQRDAARGAVDGKLGQFLAREDRGARELSHPRLVRERLPPHLQPAAADPHARRPEGHAHPRAAERGAGAHLRAARRGAAALGPDRGDRGDQGGHHRRAGKSVRQHGDVSRAQVSQIPLGDEPLLHLAADLPASRLVRGVAAGSAGRDARGGHRRGRVSARAGDRGGRERAQGARRRRLRDRRAHADQHAQFAQAVEPLWADARKTFGSEMFAMLR